MPLLDFSTLEKDECIQWIEATLVRPEMYAQNAGALEDQFCLLVAILWDPTGPMHFREAYEDFRCMQKMPGALTAAAYFDGDIKKTAEFLQLFLSEIAGTPPRR